MILLNNLIRKFYWILRFIADLYFFTVNFVFSFLNQFRRRKHVQWARGDESQKLLLISAKKAAKFIREGKLSSKTLVEAYIGRIKFVNGLVNGMHRDNFELATKMAEQMDNELENMSQKDRENLAITKPLFGVPFTNKSNLKAKGLIIDACNPKLMKAGIVCEEDAPIVKRVKDAGAILLCLTSMPNFGLSYACDDTGGKIANNPHDSRRIPGGSSSGEGALISSAASPFGIGNDIGGSIRIPAYMCGIFGLKPTNFPEHTVPLKGILLNPNYPEYEPANQMLSHGPLVRYSEDLPLILSVMANKPLDFYEKKLEFNNGDIRIFYIEDFDILISEKLHLEQKNTLRKVKNYFERKYNLNVQKVEFPLMNRLFKFWGLTGWTDGVENPVKLFYQFFEILSGYSDHTFFQWNFDVLKNFIHPKNEEERGFVAEKLAKLRQQLEELLGENGVLMTPIWPTPAPFHHMEPFVTFNTKYTQMFNMLGSPALSVPIGKSTVTNMPLGIQLVASPFNEAILISMAKELEKAFGGWVTPGKMPKELMEAMNLY